MKLETLFLLAFKLNFFLSHLNFFFLSRIFRERNVMIVIGSGYK